MWSSLTGAAQLCYDGGSIDRPLQRSVPYEYHDCRPLSLQELFRQGCSVDGMAAALRRSEGAIRSRMALLGLAEDEP